MTHDAPARAGAAAPPGGAEPPGNGADPTGRADAPSSPALAAARPYSARREKLVGVILGTVISSALLMATFIWYRWHAVDEPTTAVIVEGDAALAGTVITIAGHRTVTTELTAPKNYVATVLLEPGRYWVTAHLDGRELLRHEVEVERFLGKRIRLSDLVPDPAARATPAAAPTTRPGRFGTQ